MAFAACKLSEWVHNFEAGGGDRAAVREAARDRRHEHALEGAIAGICHALLAVERGLGVELPDEGEVRVTFDDSIISDTASDKRQDMVEVAAGFMRTWEYRRKWYGEDEAAAREAVAAAGAQEGPE